MGHCILLKPKIVDEYKRLHAAIWPGVLDAIGYANIRNYSIFLKEPENILFAYWEYHGTDFASDMARMKENETMQEWWKICSPMQTPFDTRKPNEWWAAMPEVFHTD
jgi:L-rhamnose mutarotase